MGDYVEVSEVAEVSAPGAAKHVWEVLGEVAVAKVVQGEGRQEPPRSRYAAPAARSWVTEVAGVRSHRQKGS